MAFVACFCALWTHVPRGSLLTPSHAPSPLQVSIQPMDVKADWVLINGLVNMFNLPDMSLGNKMTGDIAVAIKPLIEYAKMWSASDGGANFFDDLFISSIVVHLSFSLRGEVFQAPTDPLDIDDPKDERPHHHRQVRPVSNVTEAVTVHLKLKLSQLIAVVSCFKC